MPEDRLPERREGDPSPAAAAPDPIAAGYRQIILLTRPAGASHLAEFLREIRPDATIRTVLSGPALSGLGPHILGQARLIAFDTDCIVPRGVLDALGFGGYNFHPGSPAFPGWAPYCFAAYDGVPVFGATAHRMTAQVDQGAIVGTESFDVAVGTDAQTLSQHALIAMLNLFRRLSPTLVADPAPLAPLPIGWSGRRRTKADLAQLLEIPTDIAPAELARRLRAMPGAGDGMPAPTVTLHGVKFRLAGEGPSRH